MRIYLKPNLFRVLLSVTRALNFSNTHIIKLPRRRIVFGARVNNGTRPGCELINPSTKKCATRSHKIFGALDSRVYIFNILRLSTLGKCKAIVQHFFVLFFNYTCANTCVPVYKSRCVCILSAGRLLINQHQAARPGERCYFSGVAHTQRAKPAGRW